MGYAVDTVGSFKTNAGTGAVTATTIAPGDSFTVRNFNSPATCTLMQVIRQSATSGSVRVISPLMHDNVTGITLTSSETPTRFALPQDQGQFLNPQDTLQVLVNGGSAESTLGILGLYYSNLMGGAARLHNPGDIWGNVKNFKSVQVAVTSSGTLGNWADTLITTTENQLHANSDYAVLGYLTDTALGAVGIKGQETANLRNCGPGAIYSEDTGNFWVNESVSRGLPLIPVFNANNRNSFYVSCIASTASVTANITLNLAELITPLST